MNFQNVYCHGIAHSALWPTSSSWFSSQDSQAGSSSIVAVGHGIWQEGVDWLSPISQLCYRSNVGTVPELVSHGRERRSGRSRENQRNQGVKYGANKSRRCLFRRLYLKTWCIRIEVCDFVSQTTKSWLYQPGYGAAN